MIPSSPKYEILGCIVHLTVKHSICQTGHIFNVCSDSTIKLNLFRMNINYKNICLFQIIVLLLYYQIQNYEGN